MAVAWRERELIQSIFDAAADSERWADVMWQLAKEVDSPAPGISVRSPWARDAGEMLLLGFTPELEEGWLAAHRRDPGMAALLETIPLGRLHNFNDAFGRQGFYDRPFFREWAGPAGVQWSIGGPLWRDGRQNGTIGFHRFSGEPEFAPADVAFVERFIPFVRQSMGLGRKLEWANVQRDAAVEVLDSLRVGVTFLNDDGREVATNRSADEILDEKDGLRLRDERLHAEDRRHEHALQDAAQKATQTGLGNAADAGDSLQLSRPSGRRPLQVTVSPLGRSTAASWHAERPAAAVFFSDPDRIDPIPPRRLQRLYGLTPAEAALASKLGQGRSLSEAARELGIALSTARKRLQPIFSKTQVPRQSELVRLLAGSAVELRPPED